MPEEVKDKLSQKALQLIAGLVSDKSTISIPIAFTDAINEIRSWLKSQIETKV